MRRYALALASAAAASAFQARGSSVAMQRPQPGPLVVPYTLFDDMVVEGATCIGTTGYPSHHLAYIWNTYGRHLNPVNWRPREFRCRADRVYSNTIIHFFYLYTYIHMYPLEPQFPNILQARGFKRGIGKTTFRTKVVPLAFALARIMNEVKWEDRLDPYNHHPFFPVGVTTVWDTAPIYVATPSDSRINRLLYQPKYKNCVFKLQIAVTFLLQIVHFSALHIGTAHDGKIFDGTAAEHPFEEWEYGLGDKIYQTQERILIGHRKEPHQKNQPPPPPLTPAQLADNEDIDFVRSRVARLRVRV